MIRETWDEETEHSRYTVWLLQWWFWGRGCKGYRLESAAQLQGSVILQGGRYEDLRACSKDSLPNFFDDIR